MGEIMALSAAILRTLGAATKVPRGLKVLKVLRVCGAIKLLKNNLISLILPGF